MQKLKYLFQVVKFLKGEILFINSTWIINWVVWIIFDIYWKNPFVQQLVFVLWVQTSNLDKSQIKKFKFQVFWIGFADFSLCCVEGIRWKLFFFRNNSNAFIFYLEIAPELALLATNHDFLNSKDTNLVLLHKVRDKNYNCNKKWSPKL